MLVDARRGVAVEVASFQQAALVARHEGHGGAGGGRTAAFAVFVLQSGFMRPLLLYRSLLQQPSFVQLYCVCRQNCWAYRCVVYHCDVVRRCSCRASVHDELQGTTSQALRQPCAQQLA